MTTDLERLFNIDQPPPSDQDIDAACLAQRRYWVKAGARLGTLAVACSLLLAFFDLGGPLAALIIIIDASSTILATTALWMLLTKAHSPASMAVVDATEQQRLLARYHSLAPSPDSAAHRYILRVLEQGRGFRRVELQLLEAQLQLHAQPTSPSRPTMPGLLS